MISRNNSLIREALKLKQKKYRDEFKKFLIEGARFVEEAIREKQAECIFYSKKFLQTKYKDILSCDVKKYEVDEEVIKELSDTETPQGIVAVCKKKDFDLSFIKDFVVIVDGLQDPGNLGTIIRTCDAADVDALILLKGTVDAYNPKTLRSTMGSIFRVPMIYFDSFYDAIEFLKRNDFKIYATCLEASQFIYDYDFKEKTAIIIGNEASGIPYEHISLSTYKVKIPMLGKAESLNAAVASAVIIYEVVRQRLTR
ncbi:RNA methyltransferase, TrmH family [Caloramator fervidus]|uniref:RNA methyltransferase, TrmH family n=1 Tax=Caloramator fervidus TaxID=29344 RepID=A0A1H5U6Q4_9CLOT|nr:RNA methyltransferase [Caloramator fervidus]SEF70690.1 RNA methyltransferase, TrmH family [Caloramator fervidus]